MNDPISDPYLDLIDEQWTNITKMYHVFRKGKPIVEYNISEGKIYTYPAKDYLNSLTLRTRKETKKKYARACKNNQFMLFIRDEKKQKFRSYIFDLAE